MSAHRYNCDEILLKNELEFFALHRHEWLPEHEGKFALIGKSTFAGFHPSYHSALEAGFRAFGPVAPFLIKQVTKIEKQINQIH